MVKILGVSASLRNARFGVGNEILCNDIKNLPDKEALEEHLKEQAKIRFEDFYTAGRKEHLSFDRIYENLRKAKGDRGMSNSEAALAAGLWGAVQKGAEINHLSLSSYFLPNGKSRKLDELRRHILQADAILLSGPVYFGDRGSLAQDFIEFIRNDKESCEHLCGKVYAGIAVGAKRNGGQETTLIYQLIDFTNMNMLAVGNDSDTTSQYGGTACAGDVGTLPNDEYGIKTCIGTGERIAHMSKLLKRGSSGELRDKLKIAVWLLQDTPDHHGRNMMRELCDEIEHEASFAKFEILDFTDESIFRCIACDICPVDVGPPEEYRCIIQTKSDLFVNQHRHILSPDAVLTAAYSPYDRAHVHSVYQQFIERTRYIRRDDYQFGDLLGAPFIISEAGANQNLHIRMMTSFIRHLTVLSHPLIGIEHKGEILDRDMLVKQGVKFARQAKQVTIGRLKSPGNVIKERTYNPIGYQISKQKAEDDKNSGVVNKIHSEHELEHLNEQQSRLLPET